MLEEQSNQQEYEAMRITNNEKANQYISEPYREGWQLQ